MKYLKKFESYTAVNIQNLSEGIITDKNKELISYDLKLKQESEEYLESSVKEIKYKIEDCLVTLMDDYDLTPDYSMTGSEKIDNAIVLKVSNDSLVILNFNYKIENIDDFVDERFSKELLIASKKLRDLDLELSVKSFRLSDEDFNTEHSNAYLKGELLLPVLINLLTTGRFMIASLYLIIKDNK